MKNRSAFTLIELLIVVTIIAILSLIALQAAGQAIHLARDRATRGTLWRLQHLVNKKAEALMRLEKRGGFLQGTVESQLANKKYRDQNGILTITPGQLNLVVRKLVLAHHFPQDVSERWDAKLYPPGTGVEYALLEVALGDFARQQDDQVAMKDAWGHDIVFLRWPTRLIAAHPELLPADYSKDPDDPLFDGVGLWQAGQPFDQALMPVIMPDAGKPYVMMFCSPGPDGKLGFTLPLGEVTSEEELGDDIFSVQVR